MRASLAAFAILLLLTASGDSQTRPRKSLAQTIAATPNLVDAQKLAPRLLVDLKYAKDDNFMKRNVYGDLRQCFLHQDAAAKLKKAVSALQKLRPDLRLLAHDCVRPVRVQKMMWKLVKGTRAQPYVANPARGSMHNLGCAIDLTLSDKKGNVLDMGTPYDFPGRLAQPRLERAFRLKGKLSAAQWKNRLLLRAVMVEGGFIPLAIEWWHFDCVDKKSARRLFRQVP